MVKGHMLLQKEGVRFVVTIVSNSLEVETCEEHHEEARMLIQDIKNFLNEHNFYRGKRISLGLEITFLSKVGQRDWNSIILDAELKNSIRENTVGFLRNLPEIREKGIPLKRGVILAGDPGTGKTIICKALMAEAEGITCITTNAYSMVQGGYISDIYALAQDLSPSIIFIEDIDAVAQERHYSYRGTPPLLALLAEMDGITERTAVVTVATSNCLEALDRALRERPQRFDLICKLPKPNREQRAELIRNISKKIPVPEDTLEYLVDKTGGCTPAQVQGVLHSMAISQVVKKTGVTRFTRCDVDLALGQVTFNKLGPIGFNAIRSHYTANSIDQNRRREGPSSEGGNEGEIKFH